MKFNQLNKIHRLYILGTIIGITVVIFGVSSVLQISKDMSEIRLQQKGTTYNRLLKDVLREVQMYRGLLFVSDEEIQVEQMKLGEVNINKRLDALDQYDVVVGEELHTTEAYHQLVNDWKGILEKASFASTSELKESLTNLIEDLMDLMMDVSDHSRLMLSSEIYAHYLVHHVVSDLPILTEYLGQIRSTGREVIENRSITDIQKQEINFYCTNVNQILNDLEHGINVIFDESPLIEERIGEYSEKVLKDSFNFINYIEITFLEEYPHDIAPQYYFDESTKNIDQIFILYDMQSVELDKYMTNQFSQIKREGFFLTFLTFIGILISVYSFIRFFRFQIKVVEEVSTKLEKVEDRKNKVEAKYKETENKLIKMERNLSQEILKAHEGVRQRLSRELHDGIGQAMYSILTLLKIIEQEKDEQSQYTYIKQAKEITANAMNEVRQISRFLRPPVLDDLGFIPAIQSFIEEYENTHGLKVVFSYDGEKRRLHTDMETVLYRISQEALTNIAKYAEATMVHYSIQNNEERIMLQIKDNGKGFNPKVKNWSGIGLFSMKERAEGLGGTFMIDSNPNKGTTIRVDIPKNDRFL